MRKGVQGSLGSSKKVFLFLKIVYLAFGFTTFAENLPTRWQLGGALPSFSPLIPAAAATHTIYIISPLS